jgi:hypothetical protein
MPKVKLFVLNYLLVELNIQGIMLDRQFDLDLLRRNAIATISGREEDGLQGVM